MRHEHDAPHTDPTPESLAPDVAGSDDSALVARAARDALASDLRRALARLAGIAASMHERERRVAAVRVRPGATPPGGIPRPVAAGDRRDAEAAVAAYAAQLRADGLGPERMLRLVKDAVRDAAPDTLDRVTLHALTEDVVRWSIEAYYAT